MAAPQTLSSLRAPQSGWSRRNSHSSSASTGRICVGHVRPSGAVDEPALPVLREPGEPLVADAAAEAVALTELGHREAITEGIGNELQSLIHGVTLFPRPDLPPASGEASG